MPSLTSPIAALRGMRFDFAKKFEALGLVTLRDALYYFPFRHEDWRQRKAISSAQPGDTLTLLVTIARLSGRRGWRRRVSVTEARVTDDGKKSLYVVWYNQPFLQKSLKVGDQIYVSGVVSHKDGKLQMSSPIWERPSADPLHEKLVPIYRSVEGLSQRQLRKVIKQAVAVSSFVTDHLPVEVQKDHDFMSAAEALSQIHFPDSPESAARAVRRLKFDELLAWQIAWRRDQQGYQKRQARSFPFQEIAVRAFVQSLPFELTADQRVAAWHILQDLNQAKPMSRLLQGDVGSGKTVVAAIAAYNVVEQSAQVALLTPTVLLAEQHYRTFEQMYTNHHVRIALLTGKQALMNNGQKVSRAGLAKALEANQIDIIIGTHALIQESRNFSSLGLVIVDEQQRFGVEQRDALIQTIARQEQVVPHFLSLTATPIPRTLALFVAGELSITTLKNKPVGRGRVTTSVIGPTQRQAIADALQATVAAKQQAYLITPLIEESDALGVRAATTEFERLKKKFPRVRFGLVHGAMPIADRLATLTHFRQHDIDALVGTTVLEVGLDVPNATLMVIEGAERFGLAQLHQLRGRVGRGTIPGRCLLATDQTGSATAQRLQQVARLDDGFRLAELDLAERGGGDLYGLRQSGLPNWQLATLADGDLLVLARTVATELLTQAGPETAAVVAGAINLPGVRHRE